ncbi:hypothetical protein Psch_02501 [Pelotomaculum schinkii]|uniref:Uncharacterized protein n=1 Tax=Pelotomaculum schinkii TaxID=78350 RepID=A0A4Y7R9Z0_9FIRM|nr:hypothetical protein [Pelotomaculum schinkii]TEB05460.1 hypothetical protein Psch_02501 [Pelotomaculum schinkii]
MLEVSGNPNPTWILSEPEEKDERALRLTFAYRGEEIELVVAQRVAMFVPPADSLEEREPRSGFWLELRDAAGALVFRQDLHNPIAADYEVFPENPAGEIVRLPAAAPSGTFTLVIPEPERAENLVLVASPSTPEARNQAAREVARFDMAGVRRTVEGRP